MTQPTPEAAKAALDSLQKSTQKPAQLMYWLLNNDVIIVEALQLLADPDMVYVRRRPHVASVRYNVKHDAKYDISTGEWLEHACSDSECEFCKDRPEKAPTIAEEWGMDG